LVILGPALRDQKDVGSDEKTVINNLEQTFAGLYWCKQGDFYQQLKTQKERSKDESLRFLHKELNVRYANERSPIITFAHTLTTEEKTLEQLNAGVMSVFESIKKSSLNTKEKEALNKRCVCLLDMLSKASTLLKNIQVLVDLLLV
jgi:hypothetical protein